MYLLYLLLFFFLLDLIPGIVIMLLDEIVCKLLWFFFGLKERFQHQVTEVFFWLATLAIVKLGFPDFSRLKALDHSHYYPVFKDRGRIIV